MKNDKLFTNLLVLLQNFENLWNMYSVSEGILYRQETKKSAKYFLQIFNQVSSIYPEIRNSKVLTINSIDNTELIDSINKYLGEWCKNTEKFPMPSREICMGDNEYSRFKLQPYFMCISIYALRHLKLNINPILCKSSGEGGFHLNNVKWRHHFSWQICDQVDNEFLNRLSNNETVVVIGDIRKSQDLITYAVNQDSYRTYMISYIERIQKIILDEMGIFDRFTGDGFICYFNNYLLEKFHKDLYKTVLDVCMRIQIESKPFFEQWEHELQKLPQDTIGLSIGIDSGIMNFSDNKLMLAIGTPAVWANRMCAAGFAGDIILNNIPYVKIRERNFDYKFDKVYSTTKSAEQFKAYRLIY